MMDRAYLLGIPNTLRQTQSGLNDANSLLKCQILFSNSIHAFEGFALHECFLAGFHHKSIECPCLRLSEVVAKNVWKNYLNKKRFFGMMISVTWAIFGPNVEHALSITWANEMLGLYNGELSQPLHCFASLSYCVRNIPLFAQQFTESNRFKNEIGLNENSSIDLFIYIHQSDGRTDKPRLYLHTKWSQIIFYSYFSLWV